MHTCTHTHTHTHTTHAHTQTQTSIQVNKQTHVHAPHLVVRVGPLLVRVQPLGALVAGVVQKPPVHALGQRGSRGGVEVSSLPQRQAWERRSAFVRDPQTPNSTPWGNETGGVLRPAPCASGGGRFGSGGPRSRRAGPTTGLPAYASFSHFVWFWRARERRGGGGARTLCLLWKYETSEWPSSSMRTCGGRCRGGTRSARERRERRVRRKRKPHGRLHPAGRVAGTASGKARCAAARGRHAAVRGLCWQRRAATAAVRGARVTCANCCARRRLCVAQLSPAAAAPHPDGSAGPSCPDHNGGGGLRQKPCGGPARAPPPPRLAACSACTQAHPSPLPVGALSRQAAAQPPPL